jgi:integrase/recombinase XerC
MRHSLRAAPRIRCADDLADFARFLDLATPGAALSHLIGAGAGRGNGLILSYRSQLTEADLTPATINRRLSAIRSALKLARTLGLTTWTPEIRGLPVQAYRDTSGPGVNGTRAMLRTAMTKGNAKSARDVAIIRLMFDLGLRRGEVAALSLEDLDREARKLWVKGKGRAQKEARTLPEATLGVIETWVAARESIAVPAEPALFVNITRNGARGRRITGAGLRHVIVTLGQAVGLKTRPHGLRHASITAALDANTGDVRAVQRHARHASPDTTIKYDDNRRDLAGNVAASLATIIGAD